MMDNSNQPISQTSQLSAQRYNQLQTAMWNSNKVCQSNMGQNTVEQPYPQQMSHYYQAQYPTPSADNRYQQATSKDQPTNYPYSQYPVSRQPNYPRAVSTHNYPVSMKSNCSNNVYYNSINASKNYSANAMNKKFAESTMGLSQVLPSASPGSQFVRNTGTPMPHMSNYIDHSNYPTQNTYVSNYNVQPRSENGPAYMMQQSLSSASSTLPSQEMLMNSVSMVPANQISQVSSIPTPPETSSLPCEVITIVDNASHDGVDNMKLSISNSSFALPGSVMSHMSNNMPSSNNASGLSNRHPGHLLQPPANLDEGSQASSASASSSIPDEQNSVKTNSKPNFSYPPTPNTLSSPGAASMSSFHDDLECISSPGWPKTPASPVTNSNYEFANIKRPESLLKLYSISDDLERRYFLDKLIVFNDDRGSPITQCPTISKQPLDVYRVYVTVKERGGFVEVTNSKRWKDIAGAIGVGASSSAAYTLRKQYMKLLLPFECKFDRGGIDPQPIINMVEASSRKKGKSSPGSGYGNTGHYNQGYPQTMERYHSGYPQSYQAPRYQCNSNVDYSSNGMHYPQATNSLPHNSAAPSQYPQYSANYRYYQANNSATNTTYCNSTPNNNSNLCGFGRNTSSTPVPQDQGYYNHQYLTSQHQEQNTEGVYASSQVSLLQESTNSLPSENQVNKPEQVASYPAVNNISDVLPLNSGCSTYHKSKSENCGDVNLDIPLTGSTTCSLQDNNSCFNNGFSSPTKLVTVNQTSASKNFTSIGNVPQAYQQPVEILPNKLSEPNCYANSPLPASYPNQSQGSYTEQIQSSYGVQKMPYHADYQRKEQSQYARFTETQNDSYQGSEIPPGTQVDKHCNALSCETTVSPKAYQYSCSISKSSVYPYPPQPGNGKKEIKSSEYSNDLGNRPQKAWFTEQNQTAPQQIRSRPQLKKSLFNSDGKQLSDASRPRKSWLSFQNSAAIPNKSQSNSSSLQAQSISGLPNKAQPQTNSSCPTQAFQSHIKKPFEFPPDTIESIKPVAVKRRRCPAKRLGATDPWRLMLALKSGLLAESTWALDTISIMLADNSTVVYFNLEHLPGLLNVLVDHYRCFLNKIFDLAEDLELSQVIPSKTSDHSSCLGSSDIFSSEGSEKILDTTNFTYKTRCNKKVEIQYDEALFLIDPKCSWDTHDGFKILPEHWFKGGGDITSHIQTCFATSTEEVKFFRELKNEKYKDIKDKESSKSRSNFLKSSLICKGEPIVILKKFNFQENKLKREIGMEIDIDDSTSVSMSSCIDKNVDKFPSQEIKTNENYDQVLVKNKKMCNTEDESILKNSLESNNSFAENSAKESAESDIIETNHVNNSVSFSGKFVSSSEKESINSTNNLEIHNQEDLTLNTVSDVETNKSKSEMNKSSSEAIKMVKLEKEEPSTFSRLRGSASSRKRFLCENLEDEAYCFDEPALCVMSDPQDMLSRRCVCVSTILRNLSFVPGNDLIMAKNPGVLVLLGRLLLLHHEHKPAKNAYHKYEKEIDGNNTWSDSCTSLKNEYEWWWSTLNVLRDNTLVILSNISGQLDLSPFPEEVSLPILDGLLHWAVCPSSYAQDPLPSRSLSSVLSPQRLCLETLCKLSVLSSNVDLVTATPPWSRIENLLALLTKSLSLGQDQIMREFAIILLSNISQSDVVAARTIAEQSRCIAYLIGFIEEAEANAFQIASSQGTKKLRDKPELMGTTPGMVLRAANTLKNLAIVPENQMLFMRHQPQLLSLVMSQVMDQELLTVIADVLFYCSDDVLGEVSNYLPFS